MSSHKKIDGILEDREEIYGDAEKNFSITGKIWGALLGSEEIPAWKVALMFDAYKSVRCVANPAHEDSWQDKLGYTIHGQEIALAHGA